MAIAYSSLVQRVRTEIRANFKDSVTLASSMASGDTTAVLSLGLGPRVSEKDLLEANSELMLVEEAPLHLTYINSELNSTDTYMLVDSTSNIVVSSVLKLDSELLSVTALSANFYFSAERGVNGSNAVSHNNNAPLYNQDVIRVVRGYQGTSAVTQPSATTTVNIVDVWSTNEISNALSAAVNYMWPYMYQDYQPTVLASALAVNSSQTHFTASLPTGVESVGKIKVTDVSGTYQRDLVTFNVRQGNTDGAHILEVNEVVNSGEYLWPRGAQRYAFDSSSVLNVPTYLEEFVTVYAAKKLIEDRLPEFVRYDKYSAKLGREQGSRPDYTNLLTTYTQKISDILSHNTKTFDSHEIDFGQTQR